MGGKEGVKEICTIFKHNIHTGGCPLCHEWQILQDASEGCMRGRPPMKGAHIPLGMLTSPLLAFGFLTN